MNKHTYIEQHKAIIAEMDEIRQLIHKNNTAEYADDLVRHLCTLAGKIGVHLSMEDKSMYPRLAESSDEQIRSMAVRYQEQMGGIAGRFTQYKEKYNTRQKLLEHAADFKSETQKIFQEIDQRIAKEEHELYQHIR